MEQHGASIRHLDMNTINNLQKNFHDPKRETLLEIYSGHGNTEEYRSFRATEMNELQQPICPNPTANYMPSCYRAGQIIEEKDV